jgi:hypothetical protein
MLDSARHDAQRLTALLRAGHPCIRIETTEESHARSIIDVASLHAQHPYWIWSVTRGLRSGLLERTAPIVDTEHPAAALFHVAHNVTSPVVCLFEDLGPHLDDERTLRSLRDAIHACRTRGGSLILVDHTSHLPTIIAQSSTPFDLTLPDDEELEALVKATLRPLNRQQKLDIKLDRTALRTLIHNLRGLTRDQAELFIHDAVVHDRVLNVDDVAMVLANKRRLLCRDGLLEFVDYPADMKHIGGMKKLKNWLREREHAFNDDADAYGIPAPRGLLLLGVQGAGKSLCAKAVATAWQRPLLRLDPGALYDRYVGESERRLRSALHQAEAMSPIVLWIDEIEKGFASAASQSTDGGLSQRMFGTLLTWMQEHRAPVFLIATANNIDALPPELLRKGRFDEIFFVDLPDKSVRRQIFQIHLTARKRDVERFDLDRLAALSEGFSGAEIEQAIVAALHTAYAANHPANALKTEDLERALRYTTPLSVTMRERIEHLRAWAAERCRPAD